MGAPKKTKPLAKPQPTLRGYPAWVLLEWSAKKGPTISEVAAEIITKWIDENQESLAVRKLAEGDFGGPVSAPVLAYTSKGEGGEEEAGEERAPLAE